VAKTYPKIILIEHSWHCSWQLEASADVKKTTLQKSSWTPILQLLRLCPYIVTQLRKMDHILCLGYLPMWQHRIKNYIYIFIEVWAENAQCQCRFCYNQVKVSHLTYENHIGTLYCIDMAETWQILDIMCQTHCNLIKNAKHNIWSSHLHCRSSSLREVIIPTCKMQCRTVFVFKSAKANVYV
jgi:hypothetical protein